VSLQDHYDDELKKTMFHDTTPDLQNQDQDRSFFGLRPVLSKTDGLRPHHWFLAVQKRNPLLI